MPDTPLSLKHPETPGAEDTALAQESRSHVAANGALQLIAELISKLRVSRFSWWTPGLLRGTWDATDRLGWFEQRPDIRQRITCSLTGLKPKAARNKRPDFQAALIDSVIDDGDVTVDQFENEFDAIELAAYAPAAEIWSRFRERMPWDEDSASNQELVAWLIDRLLASFSTIEGMTRKPLLTPHAIRTTIPGKIWHSRIPLEVRVAIDELRFRREQEKPGEPFHAVHELGIATPAVIAESIPLRDLLCVFDTAEKAMGLSLSRGITTAPKVAELTAAAPAIRAEERTAVAEQPAPARAPKVAELPATTSAPKVAELPAATSAPKAAELPATTSAPKIAELPATTSAPKIAELPAATPAPKVADLPAAAPSPKVAEAARAEPPKVEVKAPPAASPPPPPPAKVAEMKPQPAPPPVEKAPEKTAEQASERALDRWERMATKVLERVSKEKENSGSGETRGKDR